ncbi:MAG: hypothetical protein GXO07_03065 [Crenarchaeota archaeon]|nr:hypothetical protein [Thermoproteota archaeon]
MNTTALNITSIKICAADFQLFVAMSIAVSAAAVLGVGIGLYLCRRSLRVREG